MSSDWQIPRNCLAWLLLAQLVLIAPHIEWLPSWILAVYALCVLWRVMVFQGRWALPGRVVKWLLALACCVGVFASYSTYVGLEPTVALIIAGFALKLIEVSTKRDVYFIIFLSYFISLTAFLFSQEFLLAVYMLGSLLLVTAALIALHQHSHQRFDLVSLRKAGLIFAQALPLLLLMFLVFPRVGPLWKVPLPSGAAKTGVSDTMGPGDITELTRSSALAFRASFEGEVPRPDQLYWRGLVLSVFDGRRWSQGEWSMQRLPPEQRAELRQQLSDPLHYSIILEKTNQPWMFALLLAHSTYDDALISRDNLLLHAGPVQQRIRYELSSDLQGRLGESLTEQQLRLELSLPAQGNVRTREFAEQLRSEHGDDASLVMAVLKYFRQQPFHYTLRPPPLGVDSVDDFLFRTRRGFCEHYASSFVFLMRAAGVPARVVSGYQGGEINPIAGTVLVHQFDAHAWAEVWLEGEGWRRVDPTAAVAPSRIEQGLEAALAGEDSFLEESPFSPLHYRHIAWFNNLRMQLDAYNYYWVKWVVQYGGDTQMDVLRGMLGKVEPLRVMLLILGVGGVAMLLVAINLFRGRLRAAPDPAVRSYLSLCRKLEKAGYPRAQDEGPLDYARRLSADDCPLAPESKRSLLAATRAFVALQYQPLPATQKRSVLSILRKEVRRI